MAFVHGKTGRVWLEAHEVSDFLQEVTTGGGIDTAETSVFGVDDKQYVVGLVDGTANLSGFFEVTTDIDGGTGAAVTFDEFLESIVGQNSTYALTATVDTPAAGSRARLFSGRLSSYELSSPVSDVVAASVDMSSEGAAGRSGIVLNSNVDSYITSTGDGSNQDNSASSASGATGHIHIFENTLTSGNTTVIIEDSPNGSTGWGTLATVTVAAGVTGSVATQITGTIERYVRYGVTAIGTGGSGIKILTAIARK